MSYSEDLKMKDDVGLISEALRIEAQGMNNAIENWENYQVKRGRRGWWVQDMVDGKGRHFLFRDGNCSCEHYDFRVSVLNEDLKTRNIARECHCLHFHIVQCYLAANPEEEGGKAQPQPVAIGQPTIVTVPSVSLGLGTSPGAGLQLAGTAGTRL